MKKNFNQTSKTGAIAWLLQRISAVILFVMLLIHFVTYHFITKGVVTYAQIVEKMQSSWFNLFQFVFLICAIYHGLNGVWAVSEDYLTSKFWRITVYSVILTVGVALLLVGGLTIIKAGNIPLGAK